MTFQVPSASTGRAARTESQPLSCQEVVRKLWDYLDGRLDRDESIRMRDHMAACLCCFRYRRFQQRLAECMGALRRQTPAAGGSDAVRGRILLALLSAGWEPHRDRLRGVPEP
ncbi:MAG TPA: zf-HC2 domain-containing protein [Gemmatimonadaceae bacterium]|nr:zf-HC2 domain-containing protein [Gemmatimonadaceae bacterium]